MDLVVINLPAIQHEQVLQWQVQLQSKGCLVEAVHVSSSLIQFMNVHYYCYYIYRVIFDFRAQCVFIAMEKYDQQAIEHFFRILMLHTESSMLFLAFPKKRSHR